MLKQKYESLEELLKEVQATRGLNTNIEFITHVQDLIGHSTEDQLYELSKQYKETFYRVYDEAEGIESTLRFFASYSKFSENLQTQLAEAEADRDKYHALWKVEKETAERHAESMQQDEKEIKKLKLKATEDQTTIDQLQKELTTLKAKLYDLMTA
jgi:chromosome segregation ATPase